MENENPNGKGYRCGCGGLCDSKEPCPMAVKVSEPETKSPMEIFPLFENEGAMKRFFAQ